MLKIDLHIHTVASGHAHNTILEYINQAKKLKMKIIGISDHGPALTDSLTCENYFLVLRRLPKSVAGVRILKGVEANIMNDGGIDLRREKTIDSLDYIMAGLHYDTGYIDQNIKGNTEAVIKAIRSGKINIISHPFDTYFFKFDVEKISQEACRRGILLELNLSYFRGDRINNEVLERMKLMIKIVRKNNKKLVVNSDSHNIWELGDDSMLKKYQKQIGLTKEMIINNYPKELMKLLRIKN